MAPRYGQGSLKKFLTGKEDLTLSEVSIGGRGSILPFTAAGNRAGTPEIEPDIDGIIRACECEISQEIILLVV